MIRILSAAAAALAATATMAFAAGSGSKTAEPVLEAPPVIPVFSWTGFEAGVHAGYDFGRETTTLRSSVGVRPNGISPNGIIGGLHGGYNRAFPGLAGRALVVGIEGDVDGADYRRNSAPFGGGIVGGSTVGVQSDLKGSIRGRLGVGASRVLFYATGGAAFANFDTSYNTASAGTIDTHDRTQTGYTVGGGVEYAFMNYMTVRAEYRYSDYGTFTDTVSTSAPGSSVSIAHHESDNRLQAGLSYKFDSIAP